MKIILINLYFSKFKRYVILNIQIFIFIAFVF